MSTGKGKAPRMGAVGSDIVGQVRTVTEAVAANLVDETRAGAAKKLDAALGKLYEAQKLTAALQQLYKPGTSQWHQCESIDDKLHDALALLGD